MTSSITLTVDTANPSAGQTVNLTIDLGSFIGDATADLSCSGIRVPLVGPVDFTGQPILSTVGLSATQTEFAASPNAPFVSPECDGQGDYVRLLQDATAELRSLNEFDATASRLLELSFAAAVDIAVTGNQRLSVQSCCGSACTLTEVANFRNNQLECTVKTVPLTPDNCSALAFGFHWGNFAGKVGIDDVTLTGQPTFTAIMRSSDPIYTTSFVAQATGSTDITCNWQDMGTALNDTVTVTVQ